MTSNDDIARAKEALRQQVWDQLEHAGVVAPGVHGYIPDFTGADQAAEQLTQHPAWTATRVIMATPDRAQLSVRARALADGKLVYLAVPKLAADPPFVLLDPAVLPVAPHEAASHPIATKIGSPVASRDMASIDLVVCGSVAVNLAGVRLGKGGGYLDREIALLDKDNLVGPATVVATTVHPLQILAHSIPVLDHDIKVTLVATAQGIHHIFVSP
jgi:5-formyltetrahydrofolate cyclo-ligase